MRKANPRRMLAGRRCACRLALCWLLLVAAPAAFAQSDPEDADRTEAQRRAAEQEVDREEAEFRRRMELEEGPAMDDDPVLGPLPGVVDVDPALGEEDPLPPDSRDHLDKLMTELIIENGRWEPADAQREAPFEPSEAARRDPELAADEAVAWAEMVAAYHEREAAAAGVALPPDAAGGGASQTAGEGEGVGANQGSGQGSGQGMGQGAGQGSGQGTGQGSSQGSGPGSSSPAAAEDRVPQDETFSALEFLRGGQAAAPDEPGPGAGPGPETGQEAGQETEQATGQATDQQQQQGQNPGQEPAQELGQAPEQRPGQDPVGTPEAAATAAEELPPLPGERSATDEDATGPASDDPAGEPMEAGPGGDATVPAAALEALFNEPAGAAEAEPGSAPDAAMDQEPLPPPDPDPDQDPDPDPASAPQGEPPTGFLAWLRRLFGG